jgi:hypothetical protein
MTNVEIAKRGLAWLPTLKLDGDIANALRLLEPIASGKNVIVPKALLLNVAEALKEEADNISPSTTVHPAPFMNRLANNLIAAAEETP